MRNNNRSWIVVFLFTLFIAACDSPTEPNCEVYASVVPTNVVRPYNTSDWLSLIVSNEGGKEQTVEEISMVLSGNAVMWGVHLRSNGVSVSPTTVVLSVNDRENGVRLPLAPIEPLVIPPHQAVWIDLRAELLNEGWTSGFTITVKDLRLTSGCPVRGIPVTHTVIMGPATPITEKG